MLGNYLRNRIVNVDCIKFMRTMPDACVDFILTDIPYGGVNEAFGDTRGGFNNIRTLNRGAADIVTFSLGDFLPEAYRLVRNSLIIFCGWGQYSEILKFFIDCAGTARGIIWEKTNPLPMNGKHVYLSGIEHGVWFKKRGAKTFNAFCKNTVFRYPIGSAKLHPTEKNHGILKELILDNTNPGQLVFDPCAGSGSSLYIAKQLGRRYFGCELDEKFCALANKRLNEKSY